MEVAEVKALADERQLINEGSIYAFYPMALSYPLPEQSVPGVQPPDGATEKDRCLANSAGEDLLFPALNARRLAVVVQVGDAGRSSA